jgi:ABC-type Fe3+ transport system permease subunit
MRNLETVGVQGHRKNYPKPYYNRDEEVYTKTVTRISKGFVAINAFSTLLLVTAIYFKEYPGAVVVCCVLAFVFTWCSFMLPEHEKYTTTEYTTTRKKERMKSNRRDLISRLTFVSVLIAFIYGNLYVMADQPDTFNYDKIYSGFITTIFIATVCGALITAIKLIIGASIFKKR